MSSKLPDHLAQVIGSFQDASQRISSETNKLNSNAVLKEISKGLIQAGFQVEKSSSTDGKIRVPVLFGKNGQVEKWFHADAFAEVKKTVIEIEAGRAVTNYQFLKDLFEACVMVNVEFLVIAVRKVYRNSHDFEKVITFFETLYASNRIALPLNGILVIGY